MRVKRALLGEHPRALVWLLVPTALALFMDVALRGLVIIGFAPQGKAIYGSSLLISAGFWMLPLWTIARLHGIWLAGSTARRRLLARAGSLALLVLWVFPFATFSYGGQALYHRVVHAYMGRDTVRLGFALRGTVSDWFAAWGSSLALVAMVIGGIVITIGLGFLLARRVTSRVSGAPPILTVFTFAGALFCMWIDMVDSRFLQAATPDDCFAHGFVHALRVGITGAGRTSKGISLRTPAPLPPLTSAGPRPNVLLILTESVRADAICSDPATCKARFLDEVVPDRVPLGTLTTPSSGTFGSCMVLWTGLPVTADVKAAHSAPLLWELAHAVGYRTSYVTSQNLQFENFGAYVQHAGIDVLAGAVDLGGLRQEQLGAPDERATAAMLRFVRGVSPGTPYFGVLHLSNTHAPYRVAEDLQPFTPHSTNPVGDGNAFHNHYRNSVLLQERLVAGLLRELRALPGWDETVVFFVSDHGEQFRERGGLYHLHSLFDEEVRIPGFVAGGTTALGAERVRALRTFTGHRTYLADVNATIVDLFGLGAVHDTLPYANSDARSLVDPRGWLAAEPVTLMSTTTAVWEQDDVRNGVMLGNRLLVGGPSRSWTCFDVTDDPHQVVPRSADRCGKRLRDAAAKAFPTP